MVTPIALNDLASALALGSHEHIAVVGGGGKTTVVHALGAQLTGTRILTTTTRMGHDQHRGLALALAGDDAVALARRHGRAMAWDHIDGQKAVGVDPATCDSWFAEVDHVVVEADGSRRRPFKAPAGHEPVVPASATFVLSMIGADALGRVIADQCHRPLRVAALADCSPYERLSSVAAARVLVHERGPRKAVPAGARYVVGVAKVDGGVGAAVQSLCEAIHERDPSVETLAIESFVA